MVLMILVSVVAYVTVIYLIIVALAHFWAKLKGPQMTPTTKKKMNKRGNRPHTNPTPERDLVEAGTIITADETMLW
jgi:hypothetical protein